MRLFVGRIASGLITIGGWLLFGARSVLDAIGYSTLPDDAKVAVERLDSFFLWLLSVPWWAVFGFALISSMWLMWVSWPRQIAAPEKKRPHETIDWFVAEGPQVLPSKETTDLEWNFEANKGMYYIGMSMPDEEILIHQFQAQGKNNTKKPIESFFGYVRSDITGTRYKTRFHVDGGMRYSEELNPIPVGALITTYTFFNEEKTPVKLNYFLEKIAPFTFVFEYDGKTYEHSFKIDEMLKLIDQYAAQVRQSRIKQPRITLKS